MRAGIWIEVGVGIVIGVGIGRKKKATSEKNNSQVPTKATGGNLSTRPCIEMRLAGRELELR
jgi:hypothetical protein